MNQNVENPIFSLELLRSGDRAELARLVDYYSNRVYGIVMNILHSREDTEDILQETFIKVMHGLETFEGRSSLSTWIYRIAVNEALMLIRKRKGIEVSIDADSDDEEGIATPREIVDWCCLPEEEFVSGELRSVMDKAIEQLPDKLRVVFVLRDMQDLSIRETASSLDLTESAVKTRLLRARLMLREAISHYFNERQAIK
jgi:RNA polymerase sigma-70 factor, ECF subfamily